MSDFETIASLLGAMAIPDIPKEEQKQVISEINTRIANGEEEAAVLKDVFDRLDEMKH